MMKFNPLDHPVCLDYPEWMDETAWAEHLPFGMFAVSALRPRLLVELGAYKGVSYCAFCQAVKSSGSAAKCFAVDSWRGDPQAGALDDSVLQRLRAHHDPLYGDFSTLLRSTFADALDHFADASIDLLHIDGFHTYEAVSSDFEGWLPKMSDRGVMLLHDTNVRRDDFGVWKLWEEVSGQYPSFEFVHGHGLGVLAVGERIPDGISFLFEADEREIGLIRKFFRELGARIESVRSMHAQNEYIETLKTYERAVHRSKLLRALRIVNDEGISSLVRKAAR